MLGVRQLPLQACSIPGPENVPLRSRDKDAHQLWQSVNGHQEGPQRHTTRQSPIRDQVAGKQSKTKTTPAAVPSKTLSTGTSIRSKLPLHLPSFKFSSLRNPDLGPLVRRSPLLQSNGLGRLSIPSLQSSSLSFSRIRSSLTVPAINARAAGHFGLLKKRCQTALAAVSEKLPPMPTVTLSPGTLPTLTVTSPRRTPVKRPLPPVLPDSDDEDEPNPYLSGNFRPVAEKPIEMECQVLGEIPEGLRGVFLRNGPNPQMLPPHDEYHWFDGDGMVHAVKFHDGGVSHSSRYVRTEGWLDERMAGRRMYKGLAQPPGIEHVRSMAMRALGVRKKDTPFMIAVKNVANNHLMLHGGRLLALWESGMPYELHPTRYTTKGVADFDGELDSTFTAHPKEDPESGELMYYGYDLFSKPYLSYGVINKDGRIVHKAKLDLPHPVMMHDFGITEHYTVFFDCPLRFQLSKLMETFGQVKPFVFDESKPTRIGVLPRYGTNEDVQWFDVNLGFVIHVLNAYEEEEPVRGGTTVVIQAMRFDAFSAISLAELAPHLGSYEVVRLREYRLHLPSGTSAERILSPVCSDFPAVNLKRMGRKNRYGYSSKFIVQPGPGNSVPNFNALLKHDFEKGTIETHTFGRGRTCGEALFVPNAKPREQNRKKRGAFGKGRLGLYGGEDGSRRSPTPRGSTHSNPGFEMSLAEEMGGMALAERKSGHHGSAALKATGTHCHQETSTQGQVAEDDGWLVVHVWDERKQQSEVVVVDAQNFEGPPVARVLMPSRVPYGFHGIFVPDQQAALSGN